MPTAAATTEQKTMKRTLPAKRNVLLSDKNTPPYSELVEMRRLGQTNLGNRSTSDNLGLFSYVHLRAPLPPVEDSDIFGPRAPESYFLMRRSQDGFVSSTGMFKASFPWALKKEEDAERQHVKEFFARTSTEETAGNVWVHPADALTLADEYGMKIWIEALLDNDPVMPSDHRKRQITPPPPFYKGDKPESDAGSVVSNPTPAPAPQPRRRSTRSASPSKRIIATPRKTRASKALAVDSPLKREVIPSETTNGVASIKTIERTLFSKKAFAPVLTNGESAAINESISVKKESVKVEVDEAVESTGDVAIKTTHVKVELPDGIADIPLPESTEEMIAKAKAMVAEARKADGEDDLSHKKRKVHDLSEKKEGEEEEEEVRRVKRRVLEEQLKREKVKARALLGLSATLAIGAMIPFLLS
ncbi:hypothetical protein RUND412_001390 [Rhizina undulata]